jgi:hypothetical protein
VAVGCALVGEGPAEAGRATCHDRDRCAHAGAAAVKSMRRRVSLSDLMRQPPSTFS